VSDPTMPNIFKRAGRFILDNSIVKLVAYVCSSLPSKDRYTVLDELERRTVADCAEYAQQNMSKALSFANAEGVWGHALSKRTVSGLLMEFGVWKGRSINYFANRVRETIYGFDSFEGLKEDWSGWGFAKGAFDLGGKLPKVENNVTLIKGWFDQTLPGFLVEHQQPLSLLHVDCDTYESAKIVLDLVDSRILPGTVIIFDEYFGYRGWRTGEFKTWQEFVDKRGIEYEYLAFSVESVSLVVTSRKPV